MKMIDTVKIKIDKSDFEITNPNIFHPSSEGLNQHIPLGKKPFYQCHFNPEKIDIQKLGYLPKLTARKVLAGSQPDISLLIEFSVPKLLYGNNLYEANEENFLQVADVLSEKLSKIGVHINKDSISYAEVSKIHYSKNVIFDDGTIPYTVFKELDRCDLSSWYDKSNQSYRNGGYSVKWHTKTTELIVYDKKKDVEGDATVSGKLKKALKNKRPFEIIRLEARLNNKASIKNKFNSIGISLDKLTFKELFSSEISRRVVSSYWETLISNQIPVQPSSGDEFIKFLAKEKFANSRLKLTQAVNSWSTKQLLDAINIRELKTVVSSLFSPRAWYSFNSKLRKSKNINANTSILNHISKSLLAFKPIKSI
jgi:hypothetical protein